MLNLMRKNTKIVIWTVVATLALWGVFSVGVQFQKKGRFAGEVFGKNITFQEFDRFYKGAKIFSFGDKPIQDADILRHAAWQNLLYAHAAKRFNIQVSDDEVRQELYRILAAQNITDPSPEVYQRWLRSSVGMDPQTFEGQLREMIRIQKLLQNVSELPIEEPSEKEIRDLFLFEQRLIEGEAAFFASREEAEAFAGRASAGSWSQALAERGQEPVLFDSVSLAEFVRSWQVDAGEAMELYELAEGAVSAPFPIQGQWGVFYLKGKKEMSEEDLTEEKREQYEDLARVVKKRERFVQWHFGLMKEADFKDYLAEEGHA